MKNPILVIGIIVLTLGLLSMGSEIPYRREHHTVGIGPIDLGDVVEEKTIPTPVVIGGIAILIGVLLIAMRNKKFR